MMPEVNQLRSSMIQCLYILTSKTYYHFRMETCSTQGIRIYFQNQVHAQTFHLEPTHYTWVITDVYSSCQH